MLLLQSDFDDLSHFECYRTDWVLGYRNRVTRASIIVTPWSARMIGRISVVEIRINFLFQYFAKPKRYPFLALKVGNITPFTAEWAPVVVEICQLEALYASKP